MWYVDNIKPNTHGITSNPLCGFNIKSNKISNKLKELGFYERKTYEQHDIPSELNDKGFYSFLRGYFDGDGCISYSDIEKHHTLTSGKEITYTNVNYSFSIVSYTDRILNQIKSRLEQDGISVSNITKNRNAYYLYVSKLESIKKLYGLLYNNCNDLYLTRKRDKFEEIINLVRPKKIPNHVGMTGRKHSEETKKLMSEKAKIRENKKRSKVND